MSEAQKYQGAMYKGEKKGKQPQKAMIPRKAYVEDEPEEGAVAIVDVPPQAPSPPPNNSLPPGINAYDYLVKEDNNPHKLQTKASSISNDLHFQQHGYSYGDAPIYQTPGPNKRDKSDGRSEKKRKRNHIDDLDIPRDHQNAPDSEMRPQLHTGLTGGLDRLLSRPVTELERQAGLEQSPSSPTKRSKKDSRRRGSSSSQDVPKTNGKAVGFVNSGTSGQLVQYRNPAELFLSFVTKGPESERGMSINKALKRYHRELGVGSDRGKEASDKEVWKDLRVRKNERGEIVLFI